MNEQELHWIAGLMEGEGSFMTGAPSNPRLPIVSIEMIDEDVISRLAEILGRKYYTLKQRNGWKQTYRVKITGKPAVDFMLSIRHIMGDRRRGQIDVAIQSYSPTPKRKNAQRLDDTTTLLIIDLLEQKLGPREISRITGVHHSSVQYIRDKSKTAAELKHGGGCEDRTHATGLP